MNVFEPPVRIQADGSQAVSDTDRVLQAGVLPGSMSEAQRGGCRGVPARAYGQPCGSTGTDAFLLPQKLQLFLRRPRTLEEPSPPPTSPVARKRRQRSTATDRGCGSGLLMLSEAISLCENNTSIGQSAPRMKGFGSRCWTPSVGSRKPWRQTTAGKLQPKPGNFADAIR